MFGSADASVRMTGSPSGADYLPALDENAIPGAGARAVGRRGGPSRRPSPGSRTVTTAARSSAKGSSGPSATSPRSAASATRSAARATGHVHRRRGPAAHVRAGPAAGGPGAATWSATVHTRVSAKGVDSAALTGAERSGTTTAASATTVNFTLSRLDAGGPARFESGPIRLGGRRPPDGGTGRRPRHRARHDPRSRRPRARRRAAQPRPLGARLTVTRARLAGTARTVGVRVAGLRGAGAWASSCGCCAAAAWSPRARSRPEGPQRAAHVQRPPAARGTR